MPDDSTGLIASPFLSCSISSSAESSCSSLYSPSGKSGVAASDDDDEVKGDMKGVAMGEELRGVAQKGEGDCDDPSAAAYILNGDCASCVLNRLLDLPSTGVTDKREEEVAEINGDFGEDGKDVVDGPIFGEDEVEPSPNT